jgi:hypothetical protein
MKRKGDSLANSITKHLKDEQPTLFDFHSMESVAESLTDVDFAALMITSKNVYEMLKRQRVNRILGTRINNIFICKAYLAMRNGIVTMDMLKTWLEKHHWSRQHEAHNQISIYQIIYNIPTPLVRERVLNAYDLLLLHDVKIYEDKIWRVLDQMWRYFMHEDDVAKIVGKIMQFHPIRKVLDYILSVLAMWQYSPELLRSLNERHSALAHVDLQTTGFKGVFSAQRMCPDIGYLDSVRTIIPGLPARILSRKNHHELHRFILSRPSLLAYFVENAGHDKALGIVDRIKNPVPETFPLSREEVGKFMLGRRGFQGRGNMHLWNYVLQEPTKALAQTLLQRVNAPIYSEISPKCVWKCLFIIGTKKNKLTGTKEPKSVELIASLLASQIRHPRFVGRFLRRFGGMDYRRLVIALWPTDPPKQLLGLALPCTVSTPGPILFYETLRLAQKMHDRIEMICRCVCDT